MTTRRTMLQGAASLIAPANFEFAKAPDLPPAGSPFGVLIGEYRQMLEHREDIFKARNRAEKDAIARKINWDDCPVLKAVNRNERAWYLAEKKLIQLASRIPAACVDEVMHKLILWRFVDPDAEGFDDPCDMLPFAAYCDLLALTGRASSTPEADAKALDIIRDDRAFPCFHYGEDEDDEDGDDWLQD